MKSRDFHSKNPEGNKFYAKCAGGCFEINKVNLSFEKLLILFHSWFNLLLSVRIVIVFCQPFDIKLLISVLSITTSVLRMLSLFVCSKSQKLKNSLHFA